MFPLLDIHSGRDASKLRVLVVDDEPTLRLGFSYALSNPATAVETASSGVMALERLASADFDIVILDLRMPELDGLGVIEALRNRGNTIPIILCSAVLNSRAALSAIRHGVVDFLLKPVRPADLREAIEFVLKPDSEPYALAMEAVRQGSCDTAVRLLESAPNLGIQATCWLRVLKSLRNAESDEGETLLLEEDIRANLMVLAFNATPP